MANKSIIIELKVYPSNEEIQRVFVETGMVPLPTTIDVDPGDIPSGARYDLIALQVLSPDDLSQHHRHPINAAHLIERMSEDHPTRPLRYSPWSPKTIIQEGPVLLNEYLQALSEFQVKCAVERTKEAETTQ